MKTGFSKRLSALEASAPFRDDFRGRLFAVVRGSIANAAATAACVGLVEVERGWPVIVTETDWDGGEPVLLSPLANLDDTTDEGLRVLAAFRCDPDEGLILSPQTAVLSCEAANV